MLTPTMKSVVAVDGSPVRRLSGGEAMKAIAKAQTEKRVAPVTVRAHGLQITADRNIESPSLIAVTNRIMDVVGSQKITGHRSPTQRGRRRSAFAGSLPGVIAAAGVNALATGALNATTSGNSELFVDFPSPKVYWTLAHGISLKTGKLALDWLMTVTILAQGGEHFFKIETTHVTTQNGALVNGAYYGQLKAALTTALNAPIDDTTAWEPSSVLRAFSIPFNGSWSGAYDAWADLVARMTPPAGSSNKPRARPTESRLKNRHRTPNRAMRTVEHTE